MNLQTFAPVAHALARSKGWWDEPRSEIRLRNLIRTEVAEAYEAWREKGTAPWYEGAKPCGLPSELADIIIRVCDAAEYLERTQELPRDTERGRLYAIDLDGHFDELFEAIALVEWCDLAYSLAASLHIDLDAAVLEKHEYNKSRSFRHGGKRA